MPKVSVIIPVYNAEKFIERTVQSVLAQTDDDFELILVNDGSKDSSPEICNYFAEVDARVRVFHQENGGPGAARNKGIIEAQGRYLAYVDADDTVEPDWLERMVTLQTDSNTDLVCCGYNKVVTKDGHVRKRKSYKPQPQIYQSRNEIRENIERILYGGFFNSLWNKLYLRQIIVEHEILMEDDLPFGEDFLFNLEYLVKSDTMHFADISCYNYAVHQDSITHRFRHDKYELLDRIDTRRREILHRSDYDLDLVDRDRIRIVYSCFLDLFHKENSMNYAEKLAYIGRIVKLDKTQDVLDRYVAKGFSENLQVKVLKTGVPCVILCISVLFWLIKFKVLDEMRFRRHEP